MLDWLAQINPRLGNYLAGFADGEGSFNVSLRKRDDHNLGWQIVLCFNVSQKESYILSQYKKILGCGRLIQRRSDGLYMYSVTNNLSIKEKVIPFFQKYSFISETKKRNFSIFCQIAELVFSKQYLNEQGFNKILKLRESLNQGKGRKRKYVMNDVIKSRQENPQRLHAKPRQFRSESTRMI